MGDLLEISFLGATQTVTGSKFLVSHGSTKVLVDCGLFQGLKDLRLKNWRELPFDPRDIDAVVLTHAHIDHSGYIPVLVKRGFRGNVYCTAPTTALCKILLPDCGHINEEDANYANRKGFSKHKPALPLYTEREAIESLELFQSIELKKSFQIGSLDFTLHSAGHILGAANVTVSNGSSSCVFSGDIGRYDDLLEDEPETIPGASTIVMESTYGNRCHPEVDPVQSLADVINKVVNRSGVLLIPAFAVGRSQTLLYCIYQAFKRKLTPRIPVFLNSPMATKVTELYRNYVNWHRLDEKTCEEACAIAQFVSSVEDSKALNQVKGPVIIISASGMLTGGRVLHHLKHFGPDPKNLILLAGFQAAGTRGATLVEGGTSLKIHGDYVPINAEVNHLDIYSAHADQHDLLRWLSKCQTPAKDIYLVHGEPAASDELRRRIFETFGCNVHTPTYKQTIQI